MATIIGDLLVRIGGEIKGLEKSLNEGNSLLETFADKAESAMKALTTVAVGAGIYKLASAIATVTVEVAAQAEQTERLSQITGFSSKTFQEWGVALNRARLAPEDLAVSMRGLSKNLISARDSSSESAQAFRDMGLDIENLGSTDQVIRKVADKFKDMENGADKTALAMQLFGRAGMQLIPFLNQGSAAIDDATEAAHRMGLVLSADAMKSLTDLDDAVDDMGSSMEGFKKQVGAAFAPAVKWFVDLSAAGIQLSTQVFMGLSTAAVTLTARMVGLFNTFAAIIVSVGTLDIVTKEGLASLKAKITAINDETTAIINLARENGKATTSEVTSTETRKRTAKELGEQQERLGRQIVEQTKIELSLIEQKKTAEQRRGQMLVDQAKLEFQLKQKAIADELTGNAELARANLNFLKAKAENQFALFRDTDALRKAANDSINADLAERLNKEGLTQDQITAIHTEAEAARMGVARQFPTFWEEQLVLMQQSAMFTWSTIQSQFSSAISGMILGTTTFAQFTQQMLATVLNAVVAFLVQMAVQWALTQAFKDATDAAGLAAHIGVEKAKTVATLAAEKARVVASIAAGKVMIASMGATLAAVAALGTATITIMGSVVGTVVAMMLAIGSALQSIPVVGNILGAAIITSAINLAIGGSAAIGFGTAAIATAVGAAGAVIGTVGAIPALASGGLVTGPTLAMVGEAGPEAVVPLDRLNSLMGGFEQHIQVLLEDRVLMDVMVDKLIPALRIRGLEV